MSDPTPQDIFDLDAALGVTFERRKAPRDPVECGQKPPKAKPVRHTEWNNLHTFEFTGYVAKVTRFECAMCSNLWDHLEGVFIEEMHLPSGSRRLQAMSDKGQFPMGGGHRKEVETKQVPMCGGCIGDLGFDKEVEANAQPRTLLVR